MVVLSQTHTHTHTHKQLSSLMSSRRHWVVLRKQSETRPACLELYKNEDQATAPGRTINLDKKASYYEGRIREELL